MSCSPTPVIPPDIPVRHQAVRPLCALMTIFVVVIVFGLAVGLAQSTWLDRSPHSAGASEAEPAMTLAADINQPEAESIASR
jgi:hypothetical protein